MKPKVCNELWPSSDESQLSNVFRNSKLRAAFIKDKMWEQNKVITVGFYPTDNKPHLQWTDIKVFTKKGRKYDPIEFELRELSPVDAVKKVVSERIQPLINIKFEFIDNVNDAMVRIGWEDDGSWAYVGTDQLKQEAGQPTVNFGWLDGATMCHEFCHVLGMIHEHQNPFGRTIKWDKAAVYKWAEETQGWDKETTDVNIIDHYDKNLINGSNFDPNSIMLYFFPGSLTKTGQGTKQNLRLSPIDAKWLHKSYPGLESPEEFYIKSFGVSLQDAIDETNKELANQQTLYLAKTLLRNFLIFIIVVFSIKILLVKYRGN